jgi:hypothetical protein
MRILLDECVDQKLRNHLPGHECQTVSYARLNGLTNGKLLDAAESLDFEVLITVDQGLEYQQNLANRTLAIVVLCPKSSRLSDLLPLVSNCLEALDSISAGQVIRIVG